MCKSDEASGSGHQILGVHRTAECQCSAVPFYACSKMYSKQMLKLHIPDPLSDSVGKVGITIECKRTVSHINVKKEISLFKLCYLGMHRE